MKPTDSHGHLVAIYMSQACVFQLQLEIGLHAAPMPSSPCLSTRRDHLSFLSPEAEELHFRWMPFPNIPSRFLRVSQTHLVHPYKGFATEEVAGVASGEDKKLPLHQIEPVTASSKKGLKQWPKPSPL